MAMVREDQQSRLGRAATCFLKQVFHIGYSNLLFRNFTEHVVMMEVVISGIRGDCPKCILK